jgi:hypothetical protein
MRTELDDGTKLHVDWNRAVLLFAGKLLRKYYDWKIQQIFPGANPVVNDIQNFPKLGAKPVAQPQQAKRVPRRDEIIFLNMLQIGDSNVWTEQAISKAAEWSSAAIDPQLCEPAQQISPLLKQNIQSLLCSIAFYYFTRPSYIGDFIHEGFKSGRHPLLVPCSNKSNGLFTAASSKVAQYIPEELSGFDAFCTDFYIPSFIMGLCDKV